MPNAIILVPLLHLPLPLTFLTSEVTEVSALEFRVRPALAALAFLILFPLLNLALLRCRRGRGATVHILSPSVWVLAVALASVATAPIGGWGLDVAAAQALVFLYALTPIYLFFIAVRWFQRKRA